MPARTALSARTATRCADPDVTLVLRTPCSVMPCDKLTRDFGLRLPDWRDSLIQALEK